jgi:hypothetical protein
MLPFLGKSEHAGNQKIRAPLARARGETMTGNENSEGEASLRYLFGTE